MNGARFDEFARALRSRRGLLRIAAGAAALRVWPVAAVTPASCLLDGEACQPNNAAACCTRACAKHKGKHVCKATGQAFGCGKNQATNQCRLGVTPVPCPHFPDGTCVIDGKKSLCVTSITCMACASDADCQRALDSRFGRCVKRCPACELENATSACVIPAGSTPPPTGRSGAGSSARR